MLSDKARFVFKLLRFFVPQGFRVLGQRIAAQHHSLTYKPTPNRKNVVIIGGSFAGIHLARRLAQSLPTGYKVVLIEKNSHFNFAFQFPRVSVMPEREHTVFIPYDGIVQGAPEGIFTQIRDTVTSIEDNYVVLTSGEKIDYSYLALATGSSQPAPVKASSAERRDACMELRGMQQRIEKSQRIALIGAGAVGIEISTDIKDLYPNKEVTLIHSRSKVMNQFGKKLSDYTEQRLKDLGIRTLLNERPQVPADLSSEEPKTLTFSDGHSETFDLVIRCTGQIPNSAILRSYLPSSISKENSRVLIHPTLQVRTDDNRHPNIFAIGDVAEHGGPRMGRAGQMQAEVAAENIVMMIRGRQASKPYVPNTEVEGFVHLTLGHKHYVIFVPDQGGNDVLITANNGGEENEMARWWKTYGADWEQAKPVTDKEAALAWV
ncbi:hypothetical protein F5Y15DRAFT_365834 [Xylariaceae sp. FL0016]|nr:hypothetical protein F5Y15DRAFT_365834 [Xylariaceae sp. FL0016]